MSKLGFGCMNLSGVYSDPVPEEEGISMIKHAFNQGITFFDTADSYGRNSNEVLLGKVCIFHYWNCFLLLRSHIYRCVTVF